MRAAIVGKHKEVDADIALIFRIINNCQTLNTLPNAGGLFDQDALFIYIYNSVEDARNQVAELERQRTAAKNKTSNY